MTCIVADCSRDPQTRGYCGLHYARVLRGADLTDPPRIVGDFDARFWSKVAGGDFTDCWLWTASLNDGGYGQFMVGGRPHRAHRVAYELLIADIPDGLQLDHLCRVRSCVNPWHLEPVTNEVNVARGLLRTTRPAPKTHCCHGHEFNDENTRYDPKGHRRCRICERRVALASYHRRRARDVA